MSREENRLAKQVMTRYPIGEKKRKIRPKTNWFDGIRGFMAKIGLRKEELRVRENWRRKII